LVEAGVWRKTLATYGPVWLGGLFGIAVTLTYHGRASPLFHVWAAFAIALTTAAGAVFSYGLKRWRDLQVQHPVTVRSGLPVVGIVVYAAITLYGPLAAGPHAEIQGPLVFMFALLASLPAGVTMYGIRVAARSGAWTQITGGQIAELVALRRLLERLLAAIGAIVALSIFQDGALLSLERGVHAPGAGPQYVLIFGGFASLLAGLAYVPAWAALRDRGLLLCDQELSLDSLSDLPKILSVADQRQKLEQILGADRNVVADLQSGVVILAPLLASAAVAFLPH
jgi:hypothetical protein